MNNLKIKSPNADLNVGTNTLNNATSEILRIKNKKDRARQSCYKNVRSFNQGWH